MLCCGNRSEPSVLLLVLFIVFSFISWSDVFASNETDAAGRGIRIKARTPSGTPRELQLYSGYHALVIGCADYRNGWPRLANPVKDAREISKSLREMNWSVVSLENPDWVTLRKAFSQLIIGAGRDENTAILIFFSGHGHTLAEADGTRLGYIVPVDAPDPHRDEIGFMENTISMRDLETVAKRIQSKHVLMVFDSCFSGAIFTLTKAMPSPYIEEKIAWPVRQFITAGTEEEQVPDRSVFKTCFLQGVRDGFADTNRDGYITGEELGAYLQEQVINYSNRAQHPQFGKINNPQLDKGDFVFVNKRGPETTTSAPSAPRLSSGEADAERLRKENEVLRRQLMDRSETPTSTLSKEAQATAAIRPVNPIPELQTYPSLTDSRHKLAVFPWYMVRAGVMRDIVFDHIDKILRNSKSFVAVLSGKDIIEQYGSEVKDRIWSAKGSSAGQEPNIDEVCKLGDELKVDAVLTGYLSYLSARGSVSLRITLVNVKTKKKYTSSYNAEGVGSVNNAFQNEFDFTLHRVLADYREK